MFTVIGAVLGFSLVWFLCRNPEPRIKGSFKLTKKKTGEPETTIEYTYDDNATASQVSKPSPRNVKQSDVAASIGVLIVGLILIIWLCMSF